MDYAGPIDGKYFLIVIDSCSKFLDIKFSSSATSGVTINHPREVFSNFGLPDMIVSDNAPNFVSQELEMFLQKNEELYIRLQEKLLQIMFNRNFRGTVDVKLKESKECKDSISNEENIYKVDDAVFARNYSKGPPWVEGRIVEVLGLRNYKVQVHCSVNNDYDNPVESEIETDNTVVTSVPSGVTNNSNIIETNDVTSRDIKNVPSRDIS
ncbi:uncharacterized protein [Palaemon carinicauda]|uniref:uncharacterized protein n=1 Tax=Palaemon carinicauda TaxID=392227 RepID=UPI0035B5F737